MGNVYRTPIARNKPSGLGPAAASLVALTAAWVTGCQAPAPGPGVLVLGKVVNDTDVKVLENTIIGLGDHAADDALGPRIDTYRDNQNHERRLLIYHDPSKMFRYAVETNEGQIVAVSKGHTASVEAAVELTERLRGMSAAEAEQAAGLGRPIAGFESAKTRDIIMVYNYGDRADLIGARYCALRFANNQCTEVKLIGVDSSTTDEPLRH